MNQELMERKGCALQTYYSSLEMHPIFVSAACHRIAHRSVGRPKQSKKKIDAVRHRGQ